MRKVIVDGGLCYPAASTSNQHEIVEYEIASHPSVRNLSESPKNKNTHRSTMGDNVFWPEGVQRSGFMVSSHVHTLFLFMTRLVGPNLGLKTVISQNLIRHHEIPFRSYQSKNYIMVPHWIISLFFPVQDLKPIRTPTLKDHLN